MRIVAKTAAVRAKLRQTMAGGVRLSTTNRAHQKVLLDVESLVLDYLLAGLGSRLKLRASQSARKQGSLPDFLVDSVRYDVCRLFRAPGPPSSDAEGAAEPGPAALAEEESEQAATAEPGTLLQPQPSSPQPSPSPQLQSSAPTGQPTAHLCGQFTLPSV